MATVDEAIIALLLADSEVTSRVAERVDPGVRDQGAPLPGLVVNGFDPIPHMNHDGPSDLSEARVQIDAYAETYAQARGLSGAVVRLLHGYRGDVAVDGQTVQIQGVFHEGSIPSFEGDATPRVYRRTLDFIVRAIEPA